MLENIWQEFVDSVRQIMMFHLRGRILCRMRVCWKSERRKRNEKKCQPSFRVRWMNWQQWCSRIMKRTQNLEKITLKLLKSSKQYVNSMSWENRYVCPLSEGVRIYYPFWGYHSCCLYVFLSWFFSFLFPYMYIRSLLFCNLLSNLNILLRCCQYCTSPILENQAIYCR